MRARGVRFLAGSDGMADIPRDYFATLELSARDIGLSALDTIAHATGHAAGALGLGRETGRIAPGLCADLLAVEGNPLDDLTVLRRPCLIMRAGQLVATPRSVATAAAVA